eukprot:13037967-Heterocapsa_arctica.AAC.1
MGSLSPLDASQSGDNVAQNVVNGQLNGVNGSLNPAVLRYAVLCYKMLCYAILKPVKTCLNIVKTS